MMTFQKEFSTIVFVACVMVTLLGCCNPVSSFLVTPRVTSTNDAIIIDFTSVGYTFQNRGRSFGQIADSRFNPVPSINPYSMMYQQHPKFYNGWNYFHGYPGLSLNTPVDDLPIKQFGDYENLKEDIPLEKQVVQIAPAPAAPAPAAPAPAAAAPPASQCGKGPSTFPTRRSLGSERLAAGTDAKKNSWPFMVAVRKLTGETNAIKCGGTLISENKVLLAAQCLEPLTMSQMADLTVLIGVHEVTSTKTDAQMTRRINKVILHNGYDASTYANDIAIIILDAPVMISKTVSTVCLPPASNDPDQYVDQSAVVMGWTGSTKLQQGKVSIVSIDECRMMPFIGQYLSKANNMCISSGDVFTCTNDIGGPVVVMSSPGTWTLVGINSYSDPDCASNGLKTRVSAYRAWIDQYNV